MRTKRTLIEYEFVDNTDDKVLMSMLERQRQFESSIMRRRRRNVIDHSSKEENNLLFNPKEGFKWISMCFFKV
jgi:hypothetical protein